MPLETALLDALAADETDHDLGLVLYLVHTFHVFSQLCPFREDFSALFARDVDVLVDLLYVSGESMSRLEHLPAVLAL